MKEIVNNLKEKANIDALSIKFFSSGIINDIYLINDKYIYRKRKDYLRFNIDPMNESEIEKKLIGTNITIPYLYVDSDVKLSNFLDTCKNLAQIDITPEVIKLVAKKLKALHSLDYKAKDDYLPFMRIEEYFFNSHTRKLPNHDEVINKMKKYYKNGKMCLCHNDLISGNILYYNNDLYLIDFEYATNNLPFYDVVSFLISNNIEGELKDLFINEYFDNKPPKNLKEMTYDFYNYISLSNIKYTPYITFIFINIFLIKFL